MFQQLLRRLRLRHKTSAWASGGPAERRRLAAYLRRWHVLPRWATTSTLCAIVIRRFFISTFFFLRH